ncbi:transposase [Oceanobacter sp. 3_MG-2023]|uniref:transposase n=1 Tax=Oceanobacter sp. 3_MG-2023 TaxID=3062622 RepID=UPI00351EFEC5
MPRFKHHDDNQTSMVVKDSENRPVYDSASLLKIIPLTHSKGITSSRETKQCCETNIIFKAVSGMSRP